MMCVRGVQKAQVLKKYIYIKTAAYMTKIGQKLTDDIFCVCVWYTVVVNSGFDFFWGAQKMQIIAAYQQKQMSRVKKLINYVSNEYKKMNL